MSHTTGKETRSPSHESISRHHDAPDSEEELFMSGVHQPHAAPFSARQVMQLQRTVGNAATRMLLQRTAAAPGVVQRAGDPEGLMKEHHASKFTYHHIIPENKLHTFWHALEEHKHVGLIKAGLGSVVNRGLEQLLEAGTSNLKLDLKKEIGEIAGDWGDDKFKQIAVEAIAGGTPEALTKKYFPGLDDPTHEYHSSYNNIKTIFSKRFKVIGQTTGANITGTVSAEGSDFLADEEAKKAVNQLLMWMPGNIHRGPSTRFTPKDKGMFDKDVDDGGDEFEEAAKQVITPKHYTTVKSLNDKIDTYIGKPADTSILADIGPLLTEMKAYSVTDYDLANWEEVEIAVTKKNKKKAWRLKKKI